MVDATQGRRTRSVIFTDNGLLVASGLNQETLARRLSDIRSAGDSADDDL
ncbi:MAG: DUF370 domain-containing protein [Armatimonadota bacterium]|nr:DUF370 domain-containing protein [Armatimonadota bacterium]